MDDKVVPKIVKSNLRGVLLSKLEGIPVKNLLREYRMVTDEDLDYKGMGFTHLIEFLSAVPDVAKMVNSPDKIKRVFGIALNNLNITANKSCYKFKNIEYDLRNDSRTSNIPKFGIDPRELHRTSTYPTSPDQPYDFRAAFLKDKCPEFKVLKFDSNCNLSNDKSEFHDGHGQQMQQHSNLQSQHRKTINNEFQRPLQQQQPQRQQMQPLSNLQSQHQRTISNEFQRPVQQQQQLQQLSNLQSQHQRTINNEFQRPVQRQQQRPVNVVWTVDDENVKSSTFKEDGPHAANVPRTMMLCRLQQMINEVCPGRVLPRRCSFPSCVDIMLTHVEPQYKNFFWGIIVNPYDSVVEEVLNIDVHKNKFEKFQGGKRAIMFFQGYFCRVWVKSIEGGSASVFMVDFGNTEQVSVIKLLTPPNNIWNCPPIAIPFKHDANKNFNIEENINKRHRCWLTKKEGCIFEVDDMNLF